MPRVLTDSEVMGILDDHERGMSAVGIAAKYGTTRMNVYFITTRRTHREVAEKWEEDRGGITEAELEAMIAEQLPSMPREPRIDRSDRPPHAVQRGQGIRVARRLKE